MQGAQYGSNHPVSFYLGKKKPPTNAVVGCIALAGFI
tara:strand:- start:1406 stop:1516 length:111 start_codon:yes stop_codon:yes gene_type:complete